MEKYSNRPSLLELLATEKGKVLYVTGSCRRLSATDALVVASVVTE